MAIAASPPRTLPTNDRVTDRDPMSLSGRNAGKVEFLLFWQNRKA
jgi:hypothetical protein